MPTMIRNRASRSLIALVTALMLLACQVAFAAAACANGVRESESTAAMPCHHEEGDRGSPVDTAPAAGGCQAGKAVAEPAKVPVFALADLPAVVVTYLEPVALDAAARTHHAHFVSSSPPLPILHCRLLN